MHTLPGSGVREVQEVRFSPDDRSLLASTSNGEGLLTVLPQPQLLANLPLNQRAAFSTLQPLMNRSCMHVWKWSPERAFAGPEDARILAIHLSGSIIEDNGRFVRPGPDQLLRFLEQIPDSWEHAAVTRLQLARLRMQAEKYNQAAAEYRKAIQLSTSEDGLLWFEYGKAAREIDSPEMQEESLKALNRAESLGYTDAWLYLTRGRLLRDLGRFEQALPDLQKAVQVSRMPVNIGMDLANCQAEIGRFNDAATSFVTAFEKAQTFAVAVSPIKRYQRIVLEYARGKPADPVRLTDEYLRESADSDDISVCYHVVLSSVLTPSAFKDRDAVLRLARKAIKLNPEERQIRNSMAYALIRSGRPEELTEAETLLLETLPPDLDDAQTSLTTSPLGYYFLSLLYTRQSRQKDARQAFENAEKLRQDILKQMETPEVRQEYPWPRRTIIELLATETRP